MIWNRYFKHPTDADKNVTYLIDAGTNVNDSLYGVECCHIKRIWNSAIKSTLTTDDYTVNSATSFTLYDLAQKMSRLGTEVQRDWFATRYRDIMAEIYGSNVNIDADERPELINRVISTISGEDIDGSDDATLGQFAGKGIGTASISIANKMFPEHGTVYIMGLVRYPPIHAWENHTL